MSTSLGPSVLDASLYIPDLRPRKRDTVLQEMVACAHRAGAVRDPVLLTETVLLRERLGSTAIGKGVALPNARSIAVIEPRLVVARSRRGIEWKAEDEQLVQIVMLVLSPGEASIESHHEFLGHAAAFARLQRNRQKLLEASSFEAVAQLLREVAP